MIIEWRTRVERAILQMERAAASGNFIKSYPSPPADIESIRATERKLGVAFCPQHRQFLEIANGWANVFLGWTLLSLDEMSSGTNNEAYSLEGVSEYIDRIGVSRTSTVIVGSCAASISMAFYISQASRALPGWFIWWNIDEVARYRDFAALFDDFYEGAGNF